MILRRKLEQDENEMESTMEKIDRKEDNNTTDNTKKEAMTKVSDDMTATIVADNDTTIDNKITTKGTEMEQSDKKDCDDKRKDGRRKQDEKQTTGKQQQQKSQTNDPNIKQRRQECLKDRNRRTKKHGQQTLEQIRSERLKDRNRILKIIKYLKDQKRETQQNWKSKHFPARLVGILPVVIPERRLE